MYRIVGSKHPVLPVDEKPSCLQATLASKELQRSSHTVPQASFQQISTRPLPAIVLPASLMSPLLHRSIIIVQT